MLFPKAHGAEQRTFRLQNLRRPRHRKGQSRQQTVCPTLLSVCATHGNRRLLTLAASQTARLLNVADLSSPFQVSRPTIRDYVTLLECVFLVDSLAPWHSNRLSRLIKTPKLHVGDTGLACALLGINAAALATGHGGRRFESHACLMRARSRANAVTDFEFPIEVLRSETPNPKLGTRNSSD